jgi:hypothetical protein
MIINVTHPIVLVWGMRAVSQGCEGNDQKQAQ